MAKDNNLEKILEQDKTDASSVLSKVMGPAPDQVPTIPQGRPVTPQDTPQDGESEGGDVLEIQDDVLPDDSPDDHRPAGTVTNSQGTDLTDDEHDAFIDILDSDLLEVTIDGEIEERTVGELKKAMALDGATQKRLKEATEIRKNAHAEATRKLEYLAAQENAIAVALTNLDDTLFVPLISKPTDQLKSSDPSRYVRHLEAYQADQTRITTAKNSIHATIKAFAEQRSERIEGYQADAHRRLKQEIPELFNEDGTAKKKLMAELTETAKGFDYTDEEIADALDPRMLLLIKVATDARLGKTGAKLDPSKIVSDSKQKVRRLRSGNTSGSTRARQSSENRKQATQKAASTGKVKDIAASILK